MVLLNNITAFAPDEENYISVFKNLYRSDFTLYGYLGWPDGSINAIRVIYFPAKILETIGFSDFFAVRFLSLFYTLISLYLLLRSTDKIRILGKPARLWILIAYCIPSFFLWTTLGIRESFIFVSIVGVFYTLSITSNSKFLIRFFCIVLFSTFLMVSKLYLYGLLLLALILAVLSLFLFKRSLKTVNLKLLAGILVPLILLPTMSSNLLMSAKGTLEIKLEVEPPGESPGESPVESFSSTSQTLQDLNQQIGNNSLLLWISKETGLAKYLNEKSEYSRSQLDSTESRRDFIQRQTKPANLKDPISVMASSVNFLFVPTPFIDNGSLFLNLQSYESFAWYVFYFLLLSLLFGLARNKYVLNIQALILAYFTLGFIIMSALIEVNDGTSVRHRAVLLICISAMLMTFREKESRSHGKQASFN